MRNTIVDGDPSDAAWLNLVVAGYTAFFCIVMAVEMLQPVTWYLRGGPLVGMREVHPLFSSIAAVLGPTGVAIAMLPLGLAVAILALRSAFCRPSMLALGILIAMLPLLRLSPTQVFAPFAILRIVHEDASGRTVWMLSDGGTSLTAHEGPDGTMLYLGNVSKDMIVPVAGSVSVAQNGRWHCAGEQEAGTFTLTAGRNTATLEGCAFDAVPDERIEGLSAMEAFSVLTLLNLMRPGA